MMYKATESIKETQKQWMSDRKKAGKDTAVSVALHNNQTEKKLIFCQV